MHSMHAWQPVIRQGRWRPPAHHIDCVAAGKAKSKPMKPLEHLLLTPLTIAAAYTATMCHTVLMATTAVEANAHNTDDMHRNCIVQLLRTDGGVRVMARLTCVGVFDAQQVGCKGVRGGWLPGLYPLQQAPHHILILPQALLTLLHILHIPQRLVVLQGVCCKCLQHAVMLHMRSNLRCRHKLCSCKLMARRLAMRARTRHGFFWKATV